MTDRLNTTHTRDWGSEETRIRLRKRYRFSQNLRWVGFGAIAAALGLLALLVVSLTMSGYQAFVQTYVSLDVYLDPDKIDVENPFKGNYRTIIRDALRQEFPDVTKRQDQKKLFAIVSSGARFLLRDRVVADPALIGTTIPISVPTADPIDQLHKGVIAREVPESRRRVSDRQIGWFDHLDAQGDIQTKPNWALLFSSDSRFPELAGLAGAITGSFYTLIVCFLISFPVGVSAAIYLEEFAPKNRLTSAIEVNINNLAAVPSVVFGLLGLAVFLGWFGLPRSAPLVGGLTLALMTLPTIVIVARAAITAVPPSIREAAFGVGASRHQVVLHHVLPPAMPGIMTGTIIAMARALGETAPLLLIGMNAFIADTPGDLLEPATALPTQIFIWADSPERGFVARTSAAILVLMGFLLAMNAAAIYMRQKFERRW